MTSPFLRWSPGLVHILALGCAFTSARKEPSSFAEVEVAVRDLMDEGQYQEAIQIVESAKDRYPDRDYDMSSDLAMLYARAGRAGKSLDVWEEGLRKGYFFEIDPESLAFRPFADEPRFKSIIEGNRRLREAANLRSKSMLKVVTPEDYQPRQSYGLLIAFHGGGSSIEKEEKYWHSRRLGEEFIVALVQSYMHEGMDSYSWWPSDPRTREDIRDAFQRISDQYPVDTERVIVGGISCGAIVAIDIAINGQIPVAGFIAVGPGKPDLDRRRVCLARDRGIKGVILGGDGDSELRHQKEMVEVFRRERFPHEFVVIRGLHRGYPEDFSVRLDHAIDYILRLKDRRAAALPPGPAGAGRPVTRAPVGCPGLRSSPRWLEGRRSWYAG